MFKKQNATQAPLKKTMLMVVQHCQLKSSLDDLKCNGDRPVTFLLVGL